MVSKNKIYTALFSSDIFHLQNLSSSSPQKTCGKFCHHKNSSDIFLQKTSDVKELKVTRRPKETKQSDLFPQSTPCTEPQTQKRIPRTARPKSDIFFLSGENKALLDHHPQVRDPEFGKTHVVFGTDSYREFIVKKNKASNKDYDPSKYFKEETAFQRRLQEFYGTTTKDHNLSKSVMGSIGKLREESYPNYPMQTEPNCITGKERKYREYYSVERQPDTVNTDEPEPLLVQNSVNCNFISSKNPLYNKMEYLKSNIFNDVVKENLNKSLTINNRPKEKETEIIEAKSIKQSNPWRVKLHWLDPKNELLFNQKYHMNLSSARQRKVDQLKDNIGNQKYASYNVTAPVDKDDETMETQAIQHTITEVCREQKEDKLKKRMENVAAAQGKEFYEKTFPFKNANESDIVVEEYEIKNIQDFDRFGIKDFEKTLIENGIHVYDTKSTGSYINGNTNGVFTFKIREKSNDETFIRTFEQIRNQMKEEKGLVIEPVKKIRVRKRVENVPAKIQWNDLQLHDYIKHRIKTVITDPPVPKPLSTREKLSRQSFMINQSYKNCTMRSEGKK